MSYQRARGLRIEDIGGAITLTDYSQIERAISHLMEKELEMKNKLEDYHLVNGAQQAAEIILGIG